VLLAVLLAGVGIFAAAALFRGGVSPTSSVAATAAAPTLLEEPPAGWPLFNGKDFAGWRTRPPQPRFPWFVGNVTLHKKAPTRLYAVPPKAPETGERALTNLNTRSDAYTEQHFGDGTLDLEFLIPKSSAVGIYLMGEYAVKIADGPPKEAAEDVAVR